MENKDVDFGSNKTPSQLHPKMTQDMITGYEEFPPHAEVRDLNSFDLHELQIHEAGPLGSVPWPSTMKGLLNTGIQALKGESPSTLIDKLGERLAFERSGARLYEAFLIKCKATRADIPIELIEEIIEDEINHFLLIKDCIKAIGGDPTAQTPCADATAVASMGLVQLVNDPRSSITQCLQALLTAELTDGAAWELLVQLALQADLTDFIQPFEQAKTTEDEHIQLIEALLTNLTLYGDSKVH